MRGMIETVVEAVEEIAEDAHGAGSLSDFPQPPVYRSIVYIASALVPGPLSACNDHLSLSR